MGVEFRQRTPSEYLRIIWRRKWLLVLPAIATTLAFAWVARKLPDVYESSTLLVVRPATINADIVPTLSETDLAVRINTIGQEVMSRSSLLPMIERYRLYADERARGIPIDVLVERMQRQDISIRANSTSSVTNAFNIAFRARDRRVVQAVTTELASKFVSAQNTSATVNAQQTSEYFERRLNEARETLAAIDQRRVDFMRENSNSLPESVGAMVGQLSGMREYQRALSSEIGRLRDSQSMLNDRLADARRQRDREVNFTIYSIEDPRNSPTYAGLIERKIRLESELETMRGQLREANPDMIAKRAEIATVEREMSRIITEHEARVARQRSLLEAQPDTMAENYRVNSQLINQQIERVEREIAHVNGQIAEVERRLNVVPGVSVQLGLLDREYQAQQTAYNDLQGQRERARQVTDVTSQARGQTLTVIDPASMPEQPVAPKRAVLVFMGLALGLGIGVLLALIVEFPRLLTIQTRDDAEHYTSLPVLITVPQLTTPREKRRLMWRRAVFACAGLLATAVSIPTMIIILRATHLLDTLSGTN